VYVFAALVVATCAGLFLAQRLKHTPTSVHSFRLSPATFSPARNERPTVTRGILKATTPGVEELSFQTDGAHEVTPVTVTIVNASGETVATVVRELPWKRYLRLCLAWNGRRGAGHVAGRPDTAPAADGGAVGAAVCDLSPTLALPHGPLAPAGDYRVRVSLRDAGHAVLSPSAFALAPARAGSS
jgi:hypothetical protein